MQNIGGKKKSAAYWQQRRLEYQENERNKRIERALHGRRKPPDRAVIEKIGKEYKMSYYENCAVPKPKDKKKKKLANGWKDKPERVCRYTGRSYAERHEIFGGSNRQKSIEYGLQVDLCPEIHERITNPRTEEDLRMVQELKEEGQMKYEALMKGKGFDDVGARKMFMMEFGKNYLPMIGREGV